MDNEKRNDNSTISWLRWLFDMVVWLAENWDEIPKPPISFKNNRENGAGDDVVK